MDSPLFMRHLPVYLQWGRDVRHVYGSKMSVTLVVRLALFANWAKKTTVIGDRTQLCLTPYKYLRLNYRTGRSRARAWPYNELGFWVLYQLTGLVRLMKHI